jgi:hypothetical protein
MTAMAKVSAIVDEQLGLIRQAVRRTRFYSAVLAVGLLAFAYIMYGLCFLGWDRTSHLTQAAQWFVAGFIGLIVVCSVLLLYRFVTLLNINNAFIVRVMTEHPERILWVYETIVSSVKSPATKGHHVYIWFTNGKVYAVSAKPDNVRPLIDAIASFAPHALRGYTPENQARYNALLAEAKLNGLRETQ